MIFSLSEAAMTTSATVPVTVTPEAVARISKLGLQPAVDRMLDYARCHFPDLDRIEVALYDRYELGDEPGMAIEAYSRCPFDPTNPIDQDLDRWMVTEFPADILQHVILCYRPGAPHAG
jgi:hypothetical protein